MTTIYAPARLAEVPTVIALGNFDGLHRAHLQLIAKTIRHAKSLRAASCVYTFLDHPKAVQDTDRSFGLITTSQEKEMLLQTTALDYLYFEDFNAVRHFSCEKFCRLLVDRFLLHTAVCGENFHFGNAASGSASDLKRILAKYGKEVIVLPSVEMEGAPVSSSRIRAFLAAGEIQRANELLGHPYFICYPILHGRHLGRELGFPTINQLFPKEKLIPKFGVYACLCHVGGKRLAGVANVGVKPTVTADQPDPPVLCETHIIGFDGDLYGQPIQVDFYQRLRDEKKFDTLTQLKDAIHENIRETSAIMEQYL